ncbi:MAG TPA: hypothetical protein VF815_06870 [Myxococcaceae bacterium]
MANESRTPPDMNAALPDTGPVAESPPPQGVLTVNNDGVASAKKQGKAGGTGPKGRSAAKRKPEKKLPASQQKAATKKTAAKKAGAGGRFKPTTAAKGSWKTASKRTAGSKPTAAQKKTPPKKSAGARKAAPAAKKAGAKRAARR